MTSHISDPLPARVGLAMIEILIHEKMAERAEKQGAYFKKQLLELKQKHECIGDIRGRGLMLGVEIVKDRVSKEPDIELGYRISEACLSMGLSMNIVRLKGMSGVFRIAPPLSITRAEIDLGIEILDRAIDNSMTSTS